MLGDPDIKRIRAILRINGLHEGGCASRDPLKGREVPGRSYLEPGACNCWVTEDPLEMESNPPARIETMSNSAEIVKTHLYADGRKRSWRKSIRSWEGPQDWEEIVYEVTS